MTQTGRPWAVERRLRPLAAVAFICTIALLVGAGASSVDAYGASASLPGAWSARAFSARLPSGNPGSVALTGLAPALGAFGEAFVQQAVLEERESMGTAMALSADGNTAIVGAASDEGGIGAAFVFVRIGDTWVQQGPKLTATGEIGTGRFGDAVALSADGNTALVGAREDNGERGAAWVFTRSGATWAQQGEKLLGAGESGREERGEFGESVALAADGNTALVGGGWDNGGEGAAWVFTRSGSVWSQQGAKLTANDGFAEFGTNVALSGDGATALIGGWYDNTGKGAAWVFARSGSTWSEQGPKLAGGGEVGEGSFGHAVALSSDGDTALIGACNDNHGVGAAWVFARSGSTWSQQGSKLTGGGEVEDGGFGRSVALADEGSGALISASADKNGAGAVWSFARSGSTWSQQGQKIANTEADGFGMGLALSSDGYTALIGGDVANRMNYIQAAWVFVNPAPTVLTEEASTAEEASARLHATVDPGPATTAYFQYGPTQAYGARTAPQSVPAGTAATGLTAPVVGLAPARSYHFRAVSENSLGTTYGEDRTFLTAASPPPTTTSTTPVTSTPSAISPTFTETITVTATASAPPPAVAMPPMISRVSQTHRSWRVVRFPEPPRGRKGGPLGHHLRLLAQQACKCPVHV